MSFPPISDTAFDRISISIPGVDLSDDDRGLIDQTIQHFARRCLMTPYSDELLSDYLEHYSLLCASIVATRLQTPESFSIKVFSEVCSGGNGDLCFGIETLEFLKKVFPSADVQLLVFEDDYNHVTSLAPLNLIDNISSIDLDDHDVPYLEADILITAPVVDSDISYFFKKIPKQLAYLEYGMVNLPGGDETSIGCGVANWECGLQLSEKIRENAQFYREGNRKEALRRLSIVNLDLYQFLLLNRDLISYDQEVNLYVAYANSDEMIIEHVVTDPYDFSLTQPLPRSEPFQRSYFDMFSRIVIASEYGNTKDVDIVFVGCLEKHLYMFYHVMSENGFLYNVSNVEVYDNNNCLIEQIVNGLEGGKRIRIILSDSLQRNAFKSLMMAAEDFTCVTGDMSFSEAISMDKLFLYQLMSWKEDHFACYLTLIETLFPNPEEPIRHYMKIMDLIHRGKINCQRDYENGIVWLAALLNDQNLKMQMKMLYDHLFEFYSFKEHLEGRIKGIRFPMQFQQIESQVRDSLASITERCRKG